MKITFTAKNDRDFATLAVCSVRYAIGRRTYMPGLVSEIIMDNLNIISNGDLELLAHDIYEYGNGEWDSEAYGDPCDGKTWHEFYKAIKTELARRKI